jgi:hypothetical protein
MMSPEEKTRRKEERDRKEREMLMAPSAARPAVPVVIQDQPAPSLAGLKLSDIQLQPLAWFKDHPGNHVFDDAKAATPGYWRDLKRDITEARAILNPVIALMDGTILEGHSRIKLARELVAEIPSLAKIPTRIVASKITPEEAERRLYLGNLSRFEMDEDTRLALYAKTWPGYFLADLSEGGDTVSPPPTKAQVAKETGKSERQIIRDKGIVKDAARIAKTEGKATPEPRHVAQARIRANEQRKTKKPVPPFSDPLTQLAGKAEKLINAEVKRASTAPLAAKGKRSREYLMGRAEGMTEILVLINRLRNQW